MSVINLQQTKHNCQETIYNISMSFFDAERFARYLDAAYKESRFKSHSALADEAKLKRSTVSSLISAKPQTATTKPSQPKPETVVKLARALGKDADEMLLLAGHAPLDVNDDAERVELMAMYKKRRKLTPSKSEAFNRILDMVDRELDRLYQESLAEIAEAKNKSKTNGN